MTALFSKPPKSQPLPEPTPVKDSAGVAEAALRERQRRRAAGGRASTIITGSTGLQGEASASKLLLGQ